MEEKGKSIGEGVNFQHDYKNEDDNVFKSIRDEYECQEYTIRLSSLS